MDKTVPTIDRETDIEKLLYAALQVGSPVAIHKTSRVVWIAGRTYRYNQDGVVTRVTHGF